MVRDNLDHPFFLLLLLAAATFFWRCGAHWAVCKISSLGSGRAKCIRVGGLLGN